MTTKEEKKKQGKKNKVAGTRFELKVRKDLEDKGWIVDKWTNNIEFKDAGSLNDEIFECPKCKYLLDNFFVADSFENPNLDVRNSEGRFIEILSENSELHKKNCGQYLKSICQGYSCRKIGKLVKAKNKFLGFGKPMMLGAGFPDFIAFRRIGTYSEYTPEIVDEFVREHYPAIIQIIGVESKMNGYLDPLEKDKCKWLLEKGIFSKIFIASKGLKRGEIVYKEFSSKGSKAN